MCHIIFYLLRQKINGHVDNYGFLLKISRLTTEVFFWKSYCVLYFKIYLYQKLFIWVWKKINDFMHDRIGLQSMRIVYTPLRQHYQTHRLKIKISIFNERCTVKSLHYSLFFNEFKKKNKWVRICVSIKNV